MSQGWNARPLSDVAQFINGLWKGETPPFVHIGVIRNTNFTKDGQLDDTDIAYIDVETKKFQKRRLQPGDLILEKSGGGPKQPVGRVVLFDKTEGEFSFSNFTAVIRVKDPKVLDSRFLHRYLHWMYVSGRTEAMQSHSTGIRNLNGDAYKAIEVVYPSLKEQFRIVAILDEAFEGIATAKDRAEKNLRNAREVFSAVVGGLFPASRTEVALVELADSISDGDHAPPPKAEDGVPFITISNIDKATRQIDFSDTFLVPRGYYDGLKSHRRPVAGDVLYTVTGSFGIPVLVTGDQEFCFQRHIGLIRPKQTVDAAWLTYALLSPMAFAQANQRATGTAQRTVSLSVLRDLRLPLLPIEEQRRVAAKIAAIENRTRELEWCLVRKLNALDELKKSLLHQAFSGQL